MISSGLNQIFFISRGPRGHDLTHHKILYFSDHSVPRYYRMNNQPSYGNNSSNNILDLSYQKSLKFGMLFNNTIKIPVIAKIIENCHFSKNFENLKIFHKIFEKIMILIFCGYHRNYCGVIYHHAKFQTFLTIQFQDIIG